VGVAVAGVVRRSDGFLVVAPNLEWRDVPLRLRLQSALGLDVPMVVGNDADLVTLAEYTRGAGQGTNDFICLWGEAGVGAGIVSEGRPLRGRSGLAGEVGHLPIRPGGRRCHCGARGCWETEVGEEALLRATGQAAGAGGPAVIDEIIADAASGNPATLEALGGLGRWLGFGLAGLVNLLDPERIALGGLFGRLHPFVADAIADELGRRRMTQAREPVAIVPAELGPDAPLVGAAELALASLLDDPSAAQPRGDSPAGPGSDRSKEVARALTA
jgi:predicted NBD/HSP70 family sugar kinase